MVKTELCSFS
jgi:large subunit ribosomal protein L24e